MSDDLPYVKFTHKQIEDAPPAEDTYACPKCGAVHVIRQHGPLGVYACEGKVYLYSIDGKNVTGV